MQKEIIFSGAYYRLACGCFEDFISQDNFEEMVLPNSWAVQPETFAAEGREAQNATLQSIQNPYIGHLLGEPSFSSKNVQN